jgi:hypothetical protein
VWLELLPYALASFDVSQVDGAGPVRREAVRCPTEIISGISALRSAYS